MLQRGSRFYRSIVLLYSITLILSSVGIGSVHHDCTVHDGIPASPPVGNRYDPILLNFTLDSGEDLQGMADVLENVTIVDEEAGHLRLSTGLPDITITGTQTLNAPLFAETVTMKSGSFLLPDGIDTLEVYARNFVMESGSVIDMSGSGASQQGTGQPGQDSSSTGGGGGGGGAYGNRGGAGGRGGRDGSTGGSAGQIYGAADTYEISGGSPGGKGGKTDTFQGAAGSSGGGVVKIVAEIIYLNGTILAEGAKGGESASTTGGYNRDTGGGGGGGSGGGILIAAKELLVGSNSALLVPGGEGGKSGSTNSNRGDSGGGGGGGGGGRIKIFNESVTTNMELLSVDVSGGDGGVAGAGSDGWRTGRTGEAGKSGSYEVLKRQFESQLVYRPEGTFISQPFDTNNTTPHYDDISFSLSTPAGTSVEIYTRTASADPDNADQPGNWSAWSDKYSSSPGEITSPGRRFIRVKVVLRNMGIDTTLTPYLESIRIEYHTDEIPINAQMTVTEMKINPALNETTVISVEFEDPDGYLFALFEGTIRAREIKTLEEMVLLGGRLAECGDCEFTDMGEGSYRLNYTFQPEEYIYDGEWGLQFDVFDGVTENMSLDYDAHPYTINVSTNHFPVIDPDSLALDVDVIPILMDYSTNVSFSYLDEDPYPIDNHTLGISMRMKDCSIEYDMVLGTLSDIEGIEVTETRGKYHIRYEYDPPDYVEEGEYKISIRIEDDRGATEVMGYNETDVTIEFMLNLPPRSSQWILPDETAERTPRIMWERASDPDGDAVSYRIQIGKTSMGKEILVRRSTGENNFYDVPQPLPYGDYYVQVWSHDSFMYSPVREEHMGIREGINSPPRPPTMIMPNYTREINPVITWAGAFDLDGDELSYFIQIGTSSGSGDAVPKRSVGANESYRVETALARGNDYYVQVWSYDGKEESFPREETLTVLTEGNHRPEPPSAIFPDVTGEVKPTIFWTKGMDVDEDKLTYFVRIGKTSGGNEIMDWTPTLKETQYRLSVNLSYGMYYVQVKCSDGVLESGVREEIMNVWATANIPPVPPDHIEPVYTKQHYPDINWSGAGDDNEEDLPGLFYFIQIGATPDGNEILSWQMTLWPSYNVTSKLGDGIYYVQVMACDGKANSSVFSSRMYVGTFALHAYFDIEKLAVEGGGIYEVGLNVSNRGTIPDRVRLDFLSIDHIEIKPKNSDVDLGDILLSPGERRRIPLTITVLNTYPGGENVLTATLISIHSGIGSNDTLLITEVEQESSLSLESMMGESWFWLLVFIMLVFIVVIVLLIVRRRSRAFTDDTSDYTETVEKKAKPIRKKRSGGVARISNTPIMDPRAKRIAMAIYSSQQPQLSSPHKDDERLKLPESTRNLPHIHVPDTAVGSSYSKKVREIKALPQFSVVKDTGAAGTSTNISGLGSAASPNVASPVPSVVLPGDARLKAEETSKKMNILTQKLLSAQTRLMAFRNDGMDVSEAEGKLIGANVLIGQMKLDEVESTLLDAEALFQKLEADRMAMWTAPKTPLPDFDISAQPAAPPAVPPSAPPMSSVAPPMVPPAVAPGAPPTSIPDASVPPAPPVAPVAAPPEEGKRDVFSDLENMLSQMK